MPTIFWGLFEVNAGLYVKKEEIRNIFFWVHIKWFFKYLFISFGNRKRRIISWVPISKIKVDFLIGNPEFSKYKVQFQIPYTTSWSFWKFEIQRGDK